MELNIPSISVTRPVSATMFFLALSILGTFSWYKMPVQLLPATIGETLFVRYGLANSEPEVVEREILIPLETHLRTIRGVVKTSGQIIGSHGSLKVEFAPGSNIRVRELEVRRIAADLVRTKPRGSYINVSSGDTSAISQFAMSIHVLGNDDSNALRDFVDRHLKTHIESVSGVSRVLLFGGSSREVTILLDAERCVELGIRIQDVHNTLSRFRSGIQFIGSIEENSTNIPVVLEAYPESIEALKKVRIKSDSPVTLGHVAQVEFGVANEETISRVNGLPSVSLLVFQEQGSNLIELGKKIRVKVASLQEEIKPYNLELLVSFDSSEIIVENLGRLKWLAGIGFLVALVVLFLFLKNIRAVAVVAVAVPVSMLIAGAMLYLSDYSLNLITLFGLVLGTGMLVDNSIVVYEAVLRNIERGLSTEKASVKGVQRTIRAILTSSATNAVVFLPLIFIDEIPITIRQLFENVVPAILFPLASSIVVAVGLVPLLTKHLSAGAAKEDIKRKNRNRITLGKKQTPNLPGELFAGVLKTIIRRPTPYVLGVTFSIFLTLIIALPWVLVQSGSQSDSETTKVKYELEFIGGETLEFADSVFRGIEVEIMRLDGIKRVESSFDEESGSLTVFLKPKDERPKTTNARLVRNLIENLVEDITKVRIDTRKKNNLNRVGYSEEKDFQIAISGPMMEDLLQLGNEITNKIKELPQISKARLSSREALEELIVKMDHQAMRAFGVHWFDVVDPMRLLNRKGSRLPFDYFLEDGREIPVVMRRNHVIEHNIEQNINSFQAVTSKAVLPLDEILLIERKLPPPAIFHYNGKRELRVSYEIKEGYTKTDAHIRALDKKITEIIHATQIPEGYSVQSLGEVESADWFQVLAIPILFLLYSVLAIAFESFTLPFLVLFSVPLTILGAIWGLFLAGLGLDNMAFVGVIVLLGLTINPAILLIDRMQQKLLSSDCSGGTAAMTAVRERVRPVLMTSCTSIAALWPMALTHGLEMEMWPSFATVIIGGLITSTLLTLLIIPVGFILFIKLDKTFKIVGIWPVLLWLGTTALVVLPFIAFGILESLAWQMFSTILVATVTLRLLLLSLVRENSPVRESSNISIEARYLSKTYLKPPMLVNIYKNWREASEPSFYADKEVLKTRSISLFLLAVATFYMAISVQSLFWQILFSYATGFLGAYFLITLIRYVKGFSIYAHSPKNKSMSFDLEKFFLLIFPWVVLSLLTFFKIVLPTINFEPSEMSLAIMVLLASINLFLQLAKKTVNESIDIDESKKDTKWKVAWRRLSRVLFPFNLDTQEVRALSPAHFKIKKGMVGILGPNGAGKTTLFRLLTSSIEPSLGTIYYGGQERKSLKKRIATTIGFLPQLFGLPKHLTAREYLTYFAFLHGIDDPDERAKRIGDRLKDVDLTAKQHDLIGSMSGGMRQRLAIARTLLHDPPIIIVDEPTVGIDPIKRIRLRNQLLHLSKTRVVLFSTHVVEDVAVACDRVIVVNKGKIVFDGDTRDLAKQAAGKVWHIILNSAEAEIIKKDFKVLKQISIEEELVSLRVLSYKKPHNKASKVEVTLEDGYMQILNGGQNGG